MAKLIKNKYYSKTGEEKICSYAVSLSKKIVKAAGFKDDTLLKVSVKDEKIIIERVE